MIMRSDCKSVEEFGRVLQNELPELRWNSSKIGILSGSFDNCYRIRLSINGNLGWFYMGGLIPRSPAVLNQINSLLFGPLKVAMRRGDGAPHLAASWPVELSSPEFAKIFAEDLRRLIFGPLQMPEALPIDAGVKSRLRDSIAVKEPYRPLPSDDKSIEFLVVAKSSLQVRAHLPIKDVLCFSVLVTNWTASSRLTQEAAATTIFLLNRHLKWSRLVLRGEVIEGEVTTPVSSLSGRVWQLAKQTLTQAISTRDILRIVQEPLVAEEVRHIVMKNQ